MSETHFARILTLDQVRACRDMLQSVSDDDLPTIVRGQETLEVRAPDGDVVLSALLHPSGSYICRLHRECFDDD